MSNLTIWEQARKVPDEAKKPIMGGRLKGKTDINPMWRIKMLTELFGVAGEGWYYTIDSKRLEPGANNEVAAFVDVSLYYKTADGWSQPIQGTGGSAFIAKEKTGLYTSDECFKMALTDAISVACKALGVGADVYWQKDSTKYNSQTQQNTPAETAKNTFTKEKPPENAKISAAQRKLLLKNCVDILSEDIATKAIKQWLKDNKIKSTSEMTEKQIPLLVNYCKKMADEADLPFTLNE